MTTIASSAGTTVLYPYLKLPKNFRTFDLTLAKQLIQAQTWKHAAVNRKFMEGDHWQDAKGWIGPMPKPSESGYNETKLAIQKGFTSRNVIKELVDRHVNGLLGREPDWGFTVKRAITDEEPLTPEEQKLVEEANAFVTTWWDNRKAHTFIKNVATRVLHQQRASMRLYIPPGRLVEVELEADGKKLRKRGIAIQNGSMDDALDFIWIETPETTNSTIFTRQRDKDMVGMTVGLDQETGLEQLELTYLTKKDVNGVRKTAIVVRSLNDTNSREVPEFTFDFGGRLTMFEIERDPLITEQIIQGQKALNLTISVLPRAVITGGFLERILLNAQMPGDWVPGENGEKKFVPKEFKVGAGTTQFISGVVHEDDETGTTKLAEPEVVFREPVDTGNIIKTIRAQYQNMLEEADQVHILISGDAVASGVAREQARVEFLLSLQKTQEVVEQLGRWMVETALAMGEAFLGTPGKYTNQLKSYFHCRINAGAVSSDERAQYMNEVNEGKLSEETALHLSGSDDVAAELQRINKTPFRKFHLGTKFGEALVALTGGGMPLESALKELGVDETKIKEIVAKADEQKKKDQEHELNMAKEQGKLDLQKEKQKVALKPKPKTPRTSAQKSRDAA